MLLLLTNPLSTKNTKKKSPDRLKRLLRCSRSHLPAVSRVTIRRVLRFGAGAEAEAGEDVVAGLLKRLRQRVKRLKQRPYPQPRRTRVQFQRRLLVLRRVW